MLDLLDKDHHANLISNLDYIAKQTNIPAAMIRSFRAKDQCTEAEMVWIKDFKRHLKQGHGGLMFTTYHEGESPLTKCLAIGATLVRNSIDARVYSVASLATLLDKNKELPECTALIIPDLCISELGVTKWQVPKVYGFLLERYVANKIVIGYVESLAVVEKLYGKSFAEYLRTHYTISTPETALA